jgi:hypothetical protein
LLQPGTFSADDGLKLTTRDPENFGLLVLEVADGTAGSLLAFLGHWLLRFHSPADARYQLSSSRACLRIFYLRAFLPVALLILEVADGTAGWPACRASAVGQLRGWVE